MNKFIYITLFLLCVFLWTCTVFFMSGVTSAWIGTAAFCVTLMTYYYGYSITPDE